MKAKYIVCVLVDGLEKCVDCVNEIDLRSTIYALQKNGYKILRIKNLEVQNMGHWIQEMDYLTCSDCGKYVHSYNDDGDKQFFPFCPFCGKPKSCIKTTSGDCINISEDEAAAP